MKNIPLFTSEYGIATLILEEIPTKKTSFVVVQTTSNIDRLLADCRKFCLMCGAETVYATGELSIETHPVAYELLEFTVKKHQLPAPSGAVKLVAVTNASADLFHQTYRQIFKDVVGNGTCNLEKHQGFFAYLEKKLIGIGAISHGKLDAIGTLEQGQGYAITTHILAEIATDTITLEVSSTNKKAIKLYKKLGFSQNATLKSYYLI